MSLFGRFAGAKNSITLTWSAIFVEYNFVIGSDQHLLLKTNAAFVDLTLKIGDSPFV